MRSTGPAGSSRSSPGTAQRCAQCGKRPGGSWLSRGTGLCDHHAERRAAAAINTPPGRAFLAAWRDRLRAAIKVAGLPPDPTTFES
jgi:hypothetical protein